MALWLRVVEVRRIERVDRVGGSPRELMGL